MTRTLPKRPKTTLPMSARITGSKPFKMLLWPLEKLTANKPVAANACQVVRAKKLNADDLERLFTNQILAIHIPGFIAPEICAHMAGNIIDEKLINWNVYDLKSTYKASDVNVMGEPFNMANRSDESWQHYFTAAMGLAEKMRTLAAPHPSPLDFFRICMDEAWKDGLTIAQYKGHKMTPGLARVMYDKDVADPDAPLGCHVDSPPILNPNAGLFSVNMYLKQPESGGHLYLWSPRITTLPQALSQWGLIKNFFLESNYLNAKVQTHFQKLLPPPVKLEINAGDLVLINTGRPHAVAPFKGGPRVSLQAFLNYRKGKPIGIWA